MNSGYLHLPKRTPSEVAADLERNASLIESATGVHDEFKRTAARELRARAARLRKGVPNVRD